MVTVGELKKMLSEFSDDLPVILQEDSEGNGYSPLHGADEAMYVPERPWYGEVYMTNEQVDEDPRYSDEDRPPEDAIKVVVIWPVN